MRAFAIVLNHNDTANAKRVCAELLACPLVERVAVPDNSDPGRGCVGEALPERAEAFAVPNRGYAAGNNAALRSLTERYGAPDFVVIANPDIHIGAPALEAALRFLEGNPSYAAAAPRMLHRDGTPHHLTGWREKDFVCDLAYSSGLLSRLLGIDREAYSPAHFEREVCDVDCIAGSLLVLRYDAFEKAGFFDENTFLFFEEDILGFKLKQLGYRSTILGRQTYVHDEGASIGREANYLRRYRLMQRSRQYFHRRYKRDGAARMFVFWLATGLGCAEKALKTAYSRQKAARIQKKDITKGRRPN